MKKLGLYLHIPFCKSKCLYCDFCSVPNAADGMVAQYVDWLSGELERQAERCTGYEADTVYFGGGTPTALPDGMLERLLDTVFRHYHVAQNAEITAECNPATADGARFLSMRRAGFNRLSIGLQSAQERELKALGRLHGYGQFCDTWEQALAAGFSNLSADVMFGIPYQTEESFADTLEKLCKLAPKHLSAYALTVEPGTPFGRRGEERLCLPDEEAVRRMYLNMIGHLAEAGLQQYEISNFAVPGYESRHNLKYWNAEEYLGFGPAAHSDFGGVRFGYESDVRSCLNGSLSFSEQSRPTAEERKNEYVMLQMRLREGLRREEMDWRFGPGASEGFEKALERYVPGGFVRRTGHGFAFTPEGMLVSNTILSEILEFSS